MRNELYHYGVKGMRWGVRRDPNRMSKHRARKLAKKQLKELDRKQRERYATLDISTLDDTALNSLNNRIAAENRYKKEMKPETGAFWKGVQVVENIISSPAGKAASAAVSVYLSFKGAEYMNKWYARSGKSAEAAKLFKEYMRPKR